MSWKNTKWSCHALLAVGVIACDALAQDQLGGGLPQTNNEPCVSAAEWAEAEQAIKTYKREFGGLAATADGGTPPKLAFFPMAGNLGRDLWRNNYVDLEPSAGLLDWHCTDYTYNGHDAVDVDLRSFGEQHIGVPIFAAADGIVVAAVDGQFDENTCPNAPCSSFANYVIIQHDGGRRTYYWHLKNGSVAVNVNDQVLAGQQIGLTASSGNSSWSHLHFAVYDDNGATLIEPFAGSCRAGNSEWVTQPSFNGDLFMRDFGVTYVNLNTVPSWPYELPRSGQIAITDPTIYYWFFPYNLPANARWRTRFERPDGTIAFDSGVQSFGNPILYRNPWFWHGWNITDMHSITGTWRILFDINGQRLAEAPIEVRTTRTIDFNRAPEPISVVFDPPTPTVEDVVFCRVQTDQVLDDLDYDIVRYQYVWEVDDAVVRDVTTAAQSDAVPHHVADAGSTLRCTVTPSDGAADGPPATVSVGVTNCVIAEPVTLEAVPLRKSRYLSIVPGNSGLELGVRVTLVNVNGFPEANGSTLWVGPPHDYPEEDSSQPGRTFVGAGLQCDPHFADWGTLDLLHVYGAELTPGSTYEVHAVSQVCYESLGSGADFGTATVVTTGKWGDVAPLYDGDDPNALQPDFNDIAALVAKFLADPTAPLKAHAQLQPNIVFPSRPIDFNDIAAGVAAFLGTSYPESVPGGGPCTCPSAVACDATACTLDAHCDNGLCVGDFCRDACGRCAPG